MPFLKVNGVSLFYEEHGSGAETVVFAHGLLMNHRMYDAQVSVLKDGYRCIAFDLRGQGRSEVTKSGYDMDNLAVDAAALIGSLQCGPCHFVGLSMGGFIGLRLAIHYPHLLRSLTLMDTSADPEPGKNIPAYRVMATIGRFFGFRPLAGRLFPMLFGRDFLSGEEHADSRRYWKQKIMDNDRIGSSRAAVAVIHRAGVSQHLGAIKTPTLIIVGDQDVATPPACSRALHGGIDRSELVVIKGAGHTSCVENPQEVNAALAAFLAAHNP